MSSDSSEYQPDWEWERQKLLKSGDSDRGAES